MSPALSLICLTFMFTAGPEPATKAKLARLASLEGEWALLGPDGVATDLRARYTRAAGDRAVIETLFAGSAEETVTLYHLEGRDLSLTQVSARSAPVRLVSKASREDEELRFGAGETGVPPGGIDGVEVVPLGTDRLRIAWTVTPPGKEPLVRELEWVRQDSVDELAARLANLRVDLDSLQREVDARRLRRVARDPRDTRGADVLELRSLPGSTGWHVSGVALRSFLHEQTVPFASTYAAAGDGGLTVAHLPFEAGPDCRLSFSLLGGHGYVAVVEERRAPPRKIQSIQEFSEDLLAGDYGLVVERVVGKRWAEHPAAVVWDLSKFEGKSLRLYLVDAETNHYGQIAMSEVRITETVGR